MEATGGGARNSDFIPWLAPSSAGRQSPRVARRNSRISLALIRATLAFRNAKGGRDYVVPLSWPLLRCLRHVDGFESAWHNPVRDKLPAYGHALRHGYATTARALGVDPLLVKILMGHSLGSADVTEVYMNSEMLRTPLRAAQRRISHAIMRQAQTHSVDWPLGSSTARFSMALATFLSPASSDRESNQSTNRRIGAGRKASAIDMTATIRNRPRLRPQPLWL